MQSKIEQQKTGLSGSPAIETLFGDWTKLIAYFPSPQSSMNHLIASHQRNCEAVSKMAALATESISTVFHHQIDAAGSFAKDSLNAFNQIVETKTPTEKIALQSDWAKDRLDKGLGSLRDLSNIVTAANLVAGNVLAKRLNESLGEINSPS